MKTDFHGNRSLPDWTFLSHVQCFLRSKTGSEVFENDAVRVRTCIEVVSRIRRPVDVLRHEVDSGNATLVVVQWQRGRLRIDLLRVPNPSRDIFQQRPNPDSVTSESGFGGYFELAKNYFAETVVRKFS